MRLPLETVVLELSLKPFGRTGSLVIEDTCRTVFSQWLPLIKAAKECAVLLWIADGSEIMVWNGDMDEEVEWARYIGFANADSRPYAGHTRDAQRVAKPYIPDPPVITFGDIKEIVAAFRTIGRREFGLHVTAGATFDPGPEFAESAFKFKRHPEVMAQGEKSAIGRTVAMVRAWSVMAGDTFSYAAFPDGVPEGTPFGRFFGRQAQHFMESLGFDYLWLSNGFGFSHFGWSALGENFDGTSFNRADYADTAERILTFWREFREACTYPIEVRGTNFTTGIDLASDNVPTDAIYDGGYLRMPPPNYPSGALNQDFGLEMAGYMSRIANVPEKGFPFRYYPNDPWFWQNPWWDLYNREPFDIYLPLSVSRLTGEGEVQTPSLIAFLTIDTEKGDLDERCPLEVIPHIRRALEDAPDRAGLLTWLYPFREYHRVVREEPERAGLPYFGDWFIRSAINAGLPLNTVVSTDDVERVSRAGLLDGTILVAPVPFLHGTYEDFLHDFVTNGGKLLLYGPLALAPSSLLTLAGIERAAPVDGDFELDLSLEDDEHTVSPGKRLLHHNELLSAGGLEEVPAAAGRVEVLASARKEGVERLYALHRSDPEWHGGGLVWVRGSSSFDINVSNPGVPRRPRERPLDTYWDPALVMRLSLQRFGYDLRQSGLGPVAKRALVAVTRHEGGLVFSGFKADASVSLSLSFPDGAPLLVQQEGVYRDGRITYHLEKSFHREARFAVRQKADGVIQCRELPPFPAGMKRKLEVSGLVGAEVSIYPPQDRLQCLLVGQPGREAPAVEEHRTAHGVRVVVRDVTGKLEVAW